VSRTRTRTVEAFHEPGGARLRRALTDSCGWEIRARHSLAPPFMVQMRGCKTVETSHEPQKVAQASCLFGADRLEACPTLQPAPRRPGSWLRFTSEFWRCSLSMNLGWSQCMRKNERGLPMNRKAGRAVPSPPGRGAVRTPRPTVRGAHARIRFGEFSA